jgi:hypothetical protein
MHRSRHLVLALAAALAAVALAPSPARAQSRYGHEGPGVLVGGLVGYESGDLDGLALRLDAELGLQRLAPRLVLDGVGSFGYSHLTFDHPDFTQSFDRFELVPAARFLVPLGSGVGVYGDLGLGLYWGRLHTTDYFYGYHADNTDFGLAARVGVGGYVWASNNVRLGIDLAVHPYVGDYEDTPFTAMFAIMFRTK